MGCTFSTSGALLFLLVLAGCASTPHAAYHGSELIDPEGLEVLMEAQGLMELEEYGKAVQVLDGLVLDYPEFFRARRARQESILQDQGMEYARVEGEAQVASGRNAMSLTLLARVTEDPDRAIPLLEEALTLDESYVWAHFGLAFIILKHYRIGQYPDARHHLERALHYSSTFREARQLLIECLRRLGDADEERRQYGMYLQIYPEDSNARYNLADLLRSRFGDYDEALDQLNAVLAAEPSRLDALLLKAIVFTQSGEYEKAESLYLYLSNEHPDALLNLALLFMDYLDAPEKALQYFQRYLDYSGRNASEKNLWDEKILVPTYIDRLKKERL